MDTFLKKAILGHLLLLGFLLCRAGDLILASPNVRATIVVGTNASEVEKYAAQELQRAIRIMSGINLSIDDKGLQNTGVQIIIGTPVTNRQIASLSGKLKLDGSGQEQIAVLREGSILYLAGQTPRAALYATYTFLQDVLGARWLWPGETGEFLPGRARISIGDLFITEAPSFPIRSLAITGTRNGDPDTDTWMARNRMNVVSVPPTANEDAKKTNLRRQKGFLLRIAGHNVVLPDSILQAHPQYIAELGGKRLFQPGGGLQLCWSNAGVQTEIAGTMARWWDRNPHVDIIHFYPADNQRYCQCASCRAMGDVSSRWQKFSAAVIAKVEKTHPGKKYWTYAYQGYKKPPQTKPAPFEFVGYTLYDASYRHLLSGGHPYNQLPLAEMKEWMDKGVNLGIRGYEFIIFKDPMFVPLVSWVTDEMKWMKKEGLAGYMSELPPYGSPQRALPENTYWNGSRMALYAVARAMWNANLPADSLVKDWCTTVYGPAAASMEAYYWQMDHAWRNTDKKISLYTNSPAPEVDRFLSTELFDKASGYFAEARTTIESLVDAQKRKRINAQITLESKMLENWQKIYRYKKGLAGRYKTDIIKERSRSKTADLTILPAFEAKDGKAAPKPTDVSVTWTPHALSLHIVCKGIDGNRSGAKQLKHDEDLTDDDAVVIFVQPDANSPSVMQFAVNAKGATYDALTGGGYHFRKTWEPDWSALSSVGKEAWTVTVQIPFSTLGIAAKDSAQFKMSVKRTGPSANEYSGWPDASPFNPANFALVTLLNERTDNLDKRIILYDAGADGGNLSVEFQQQGWETAAGIANEKELEKELQQDAGVLLLRYDGRWDLSNDFLSKAVNDYLLKGRVVVISATSDVPVDKWFDVPAVKWTGNNNAPTRRSSFVMNGGWLGQPYDISNVFKKSLTPQSAFTPLGEGWNVVAKIDLKEGRSQPFLLTKQIGKGVLVLTTSFMGYNGGYEMFGNRNMGNVVKLMANLKAFQNAGLE